jgi:hypothetical protein
MRPVFALFASMLACALFAAPAFAQRDRVFVASYGSDSNPCTFGSPCKTFQQAVNVVAAGGEVTAIDSAGFGVVGINKSVTITSPPGVEAGIAAGANGTAITIDAGNDDVVTLRGLTLNGSGIAATGILYDNAYQVQVVDCTISNFIAAGINVGTINLANLTVFNSTFLDITGPHGASAIYVGAIPNVEVFLDIDRTTMNLADTGINISNDGGYLLLYVSNSHSNGYALSIVSSNSASQDIVHLENLTFGDILFNGYTTAYLSHVTASNIGVIGTDTFAYGDGTSHFDLMTGTIGSWPGH